MLFRRHSKSIWKNRYFRSFMLDSIRRRNDGGWVVWLLWLIFCLFLIPFLEIKNTGNQYGK